MASRHCVHAKALDAQPTLTTFGAANDRLLCCLILPRSAPAGLSQARWEDQLPGANRVVEREAQLLGFFLPEVGANALTMYASELRGDR